MDRSLENYQNRLLAEKAMYCLTGVAVLGLVLHYTTPLITDWLYSKW